MRTSIQITLRSSIVITPTGRLLDFPNFILLKLYNTLLYDRFLGRSLLATKHKPSEKTSLHNTTTSPLTSVKSTHQLLPLAATPLHTHTQKKNTAGTQTHWHKPDFKPTCEVFHLLSPDDSRLCGHITHHVLGNHLHDLALSFASTTNHAPAC